MMRLSEVFWVHYTIVTVRNPKESYWLLFWPLYEQAVMQTSMLLLHADERDFEGRCFRSPKL